MTMCVKFQANHLFFSMMIKNGHLKNSHLSDILSLKMNVKR